MFVIAFCFLSYVLLLVPWTWAMVNYILNSTSQLIWKFRHAKHLFHLSKLHSVGIHAIQDCIVLTGGGGAFHSCIYLKLSRILCGVTLWVQCKIYDEYNNLEKLDSRSCYYISDKECRYVHWGGRCWMIMWYTTPVWHLTSYVSCGVQPDGVLDSCKNERGYLLWWLVTIHEIIPHSNGTVLLWYT